MGELIVEESHVEAPLQGRVRPRQTTPARVAVSVGRQPPVAILGVLFHPLTLEESVAEVDRMIASGKPHYLVTANVDFLVQARKDLELRRILLDADLVLCDGTPVLWVSQFLGNPLPERVAGADLVPALLQQAVKKGHRVFFLGGQHYVTSKAVAVLQAKYPGLNIAGYYSPPFRPLLEMDHEEIAERIRAAAPDVVLVSFGCPKAEKWMAMHCQSLGVPVMIGVGGTIDFLAGEKRRAPRWMQRSGTEWVFRMLQEPHRLASRYAKDFWRFLPAVARQFWELKHDCAEEPGASRCTVVMREPRWLRLRIPERLDRAAVERHGQMWDVVEEHHCLVELDNVSFVDSTGVAWLLHLRRRLRTSGWQLVLLEPNPAVQRALQAQQLEQLFLIAHDVVQARELIRKAGEEQSLAWDPAKLNGVLSVCCRGEITARNAEEFWKMLEHHISTAKGWRKHVTVDLSETPFVESSGLRQMLRAKEFAREMKVGLEFTGLQPEVRRALRLAKVEKAFWELSEGG